MPAQTDTYRGCKSWSALLAKPHGDHHHTCNYGDSIIYPNSNPIHHACTKYSWREIKLLRKVGQ
uniref:Uncharacterized protein n=1 Tax=Arundo donax TaxID=35708 RepID=A0A0A9F6M3_ARUDO